MITYIQCGLYLCIRRDNVWSCECWLEHWLGWGVASATGSFFLITVRLKKPAIFHKNDYKSPFRAGRLLALYSRCGWRKCCRDLSLSSQLAGITHLCYNEIEILRSIAIYWFTAASLGYKKCSSFWKMGSSLPTLDKHLWLRELLSAASTWNIQLHTSCLALLIDQSTLIRSCFTYWIAIVNTSKRNSQQLFSQLRFPLDKPLNSATLTA